MKRRPKFVRVAAPGLPPWPQLYFDPTQQRAVVKVRLATWRSWELAHKTSTLIRWTINLCVMVWLWNRLAFPDLPLFRILFTLLGLTLCAALTKLLLPTALDGFFARQFFATTSKFWFLPNAIAFRSRLYESGILIERRWKNQPVLIRFDITPDPEAEQTETHPTRQQKPKDQRPRRRAQILRLILTTADQTQLITIQQNPTWMRAIPLLEIDQQDAARVTVVLTAAVSLTSQQHPTPEPKTPGLDIDGV